MIGSPGRLNLVARAPGANPRARNYQGANLLANSFRPFFLFGAIQAGLSILVWLLRDGWRSRFPPRPPGGSR
jgi:uncharacterized protein involved in response to NO